HVGPESARDRSRGSKRSVERRRHGVIEPGTGERPRREIARVEYRDIGCVGGRVVHEREHPTVVFGARTRPRHEDRLRDDHATVRLHTIPTAVDVDLGNGIWKASYQLPGRRAVCSQPGDGVARGFNTWCNARELAWMGPARV